MFQAIEIINKACDQYQNKAKQVVLTKENMESLLLSIVNYEPRDQELKPHLKPKLGIFLRAKYDKQSDDYIVFLRLISVKNT